MFRVEWSEKAVRQLDKVDQQVARAIVRYLVERVQGASNPRSLGRPLRGEGLWRYRVGDHRVLCQIRDDVMIVLVVELGHRREVYR